MADRINKTDISPKQLLDPDDLVGDTFADDHMHAAQKALEKQKETLAKERQSFDSLERINKQREQVKESQRSAQDDRSLKDAEERKSLGLEKAPQKDIKKVHQESSARVEMDVLSGMQELEALLLRIDSLGGMEALQKARLALGLQSPEGDALGHEASLPEGTLASSVQQLVALFDKLLKAEMRLKGHLQQLVIGSMGFSLLSDPRTTFKRLCERIKTWPRTIRPGRAPVTNEDFDAFIGWIFEPPKPPSSVDEGR